MNRTMITPGKIVMIWVISLIDYFLSVFVLSLVFVLLASLPFYFIYFLTKLCSS